MDAQERLLTAVLLKPRGASGPVAWDVPLPHHPVTGPSTPLEQAQFVALDIETTGNTPFLVIEIGAERFTLDATLNLFDTLVHTRAPINDYARRRHLISREMLAGAPQFADARHAFLRFCEGSALVEHSHDAFDTYLIGRGLEAPLSHPMLDTSALARLVLALPSGQTPGLARVVETLGLAANPAHAALGDAQATAMVFRELVRRGQERFGWNLVGDLVDALPRPTVDRSALEGGGRTRERLRPAGASGPSRRESAAGPAGDAPARRRRRR